MDGKYASSPVRIVKLEEASGREFKIELFNAGGQAVRLKNIVVRAGITITTGG